MRAQTTKLGTRKLPALATQFCCVSKHARLYLPTTGGWTASLGGQKRMSPKMITPNKIKPDKSTASWQERRIERTYRTNEKNGDIQDALLRTFAGSVPHVLSRGATPRLNPNQHLLVQDGYTEVIHPAKAASMAVA